MTDPRTPMEHLQAVIDQARWLPHTAKATALEQIRDALVQATEALSMAQSYGCPVCGGDCASANPPVSSCPMRAYHSSLATLRTLSSPPTETKEPRHDD